MRDVLRGLSRVLQKFSKMETRALSTEVNEGQEWDKCPKAGSPRREAGPRDQCRQSAGRMFVEGREVPSLGNNEEQEGAGYSSWGRGALRNGRPRRWREGVSAGRGPRAGWPSPDEGCPPPFSFTISFLFFLLVFLLLFFPQISLLQTACFP